MKASLQSDLLNLRQSVRSILFLVVMFGVLPIFTEDVASLGVLVICLCLTIPFNLFGYGTTGGWDKLKIALPISRTSVIVSKYIICTSVITIITGVAAVGIGIYQASAQEYAGEDLKILLANWLVALLLLVIILPIIVKFGVITARYILIGAVWLPIMVLFFLRENSSIKNLMRTLNRLVGQSSFLPSLLVVLGIVLLLYVLSASISIAIYKKKEF